MVTNFYNELVSAEEIYRGNQILGPEAKPTFMTKMLVDANHKPMLQRLWQCSIGRIWLEIPR